MPYIKPEYRDTLDPLIKALMKKVAYVGTGALNYTITTIIKEWIAIDKYSEFNSAIGVLECVKQELYRRKIAPYENKKIAENGDVY